MRWYFDFISPYAYLQSTKLQDFDELEPVECVPILFAGLLNHWDNVGPAEILPKRDWTFRNILWLAQRDNIPVSLPAHHPFNPLPLLRLSIVHNNSIDVVQRLFKYVWQDGYLPTDEQAFSNLLGELGTSAQDIENPSVKQALHDNVSMAIDRGVFGVPSVVSGDDVIWGYEATDMVIAKLTNSTDYQSCDFESSDTFPHGPGRKKIPTSPH